MTVATTLAVALATAPTALAAEQDNNPPVDPRSALQAVQVSMAPDGSITGLSGRMMRGSADGIETTEQSFDPRQDSADLPVRVLTSYRTEEGSGTDLSELEGYDGRAVVEVTVSNLTQQPQELTYDANGVSRSRNALVAAPLTVVGAADLGDTAPATVLTDGPNQQSLLDQVQGSEDAGVTNGVLGRTDDGTTVVQWASILAPPRLSATTTMRLVMQGEDLPAPTFDLTVFPGLVVDPSLGELLDAAFNPERSDDLQLQARTVQVIGDVNDVLGRASDTISDVRVTLGSAAETLGRQTVSNLRSTTRGVATSIRQLQGTMRGLRQGVRSSVQSSSRGTLAQLDQTVARLQSVLGTPSSSGGPATVVGFGCESTVRSGVRARTVGGSLQRVVALLDGYARATDACKGEVRQVIVDAIGPAEPTAQKCLDADGDRKDNVTCSLLGVQDRFGEISTQLLEDGDAAIAALDPDAAATAVRSAGELSTRVDRILERGSALLNARALQRGDIGGIGLGGVFGALQQLSNALGGLSQQVNDGTLNATKLSGKVADLLAIVCDGGAAAQQMRDILDGGTCPVVPGGGQPGDPNDPNDPNAPVVDPNPGAGNTPVADSLADRAQRNAAAWATLSSSVGGAQGALDVVANAVSGVSGALGGLTEGVKGDRLELRELTDALQAAMTELDAARTVAIESVDEVAENQEAVTAAAREAFEDAADAADDSLADIVDPATRQISRRTAENAETLGRAFDKSIAGLRGAGRLIRSDGYAAIRRQQRVLLGARQSARQQITRQAGQALAGIDRVVSGSVRDLDSAAAILRRDLTNVLLDLGDPDVAGSGLLGIMSAGAATARSADLQLTQATDRTTSYANQRSSDIDGIRLRQEQADASLRRLQQLGAFGDPEADGVQVVYDVHIGSGQ
ncbi:hypothetical protein KLP28_13755 [Nocardioidaceae bacterium]|nr:hypothetical protein KLP28_13755 [Nocardioidaceae bacterium]